MFITETFAAEFIERYVEENLSVFQNQENVIITVCEQGINLLELLRKNGVEVKAFADTNDHVLGKTVCGIPVITYDEIPKEALLLVSSSLTAYYDQGVLVKKGFPKERVLTIYPNVIEYFREGFEEADRKFYGGITAEKNSQLMREEFKKKEKVTALPQKLFLDLTTRCNLNCRHCQPHHNKEISALRNREENYTPMSRYKPLLDAAKEVYLNISGEPLMTKKFWEVLDYIDESANDLFLSATTNGLLLDEKAAERIVNSKFKSLYISMDAATNKTYQRLRGGDFEVWKKNVGYLASYRTEQKSPLKIYLQHTISREALEETVDAVRLGDELGADVIILRPLYTELGGIDTWVVPMDEERDYYYPQQDVKYYPHLTKRMIDEALAYGKDSRIKVEVSGRIDAIQDLSVEDFPYPCSIEEFKKYRKELEQRHSFASKSAEEIPESSKAEGLCADAWSSTMLLASGMTMYCARMGQPEANFNFSSLKDMRNTQAAQDIRKGIIEDNLSYHCRNCGGCARSVYDRRKKRDIDYMKKGRVLAFDINNSNGIKYLEYKGLSNIQRNGTWNNEDVSQITMYMEDGSKNCVLEVNAEAFVIPGLVEKQTVQVYANGEHLDTWEYTDNKACSRFVEVPSAMIGEDKKVVLKFVYENGVSPISLGIARDDRKRAIFIHSIAIK